MGWLALRADPDSRRPLVLVVGGVGVRQPWAATGTASRSFCFGALAWGNWDDLVRQAPQAPAVGCFGEARLLSRRHPVSQIELPAIVTGQRRHR